MADVQVTAMVPASVMAAYEEYFPDGGADALLAHVMLAVAAEKAVKQPMPVSQREIDRVVIRLLLADGVLTDGAHHKQWVFEEIARRLAVNLPEHEPGIAP